MARKTDKAIGNALHYQNELQCSHNIGHGLHLHNCDGCCVPLIQHGRNAENARIIQLLEDNLHDWTSGLHTLDLRVAGIAEIIALIKGKAE